MRGTPISWHDALMEYFGYDTFRPGQEEVIRTIASKRDSLIIMPTGSGKSLCFQLPALVGDGLCIVVSPLLSLIYDQVSALRARGIAATCLTSDQPRDKQETIFRHLRSGSVKFLYCSPERLATNETYQLLKSIKCHSLVIDEAHCASVRGHDFRPVYHRIKQYITYYPELPVVALTATADPQTRRDIIHQLGLRDPFVYTGSFRRDNLLLSVSCGGSKNEQMHDFLTAKKGQPGIIYCLSRKNVERVQKILADGGWSVASYHAGLSADERQHVYTAFMHDSIDIVVATVAFGMGIDKPNIRRVLHYNMPKNIEGYYQEIGRAGRDGKIASAHLLANSGDRAIHTHGITRENSKNDQHNRTKLDAMRMYAQREDNYWDALIEYFTDEK